MMEKEISPDINKRKSSMISFFVYLLYVMSFLKAVPDLTWKALLNHPLWLASNRYQSLLQSMKNQFIPSITILFLPALAPGRPKQLLFCPCSFHKWPARFPLLS